MASPLLAVVYMGLGVGMTRMNFLQILGTMMAPRASSATAYAIGFLAHSVLAVGFGIVHVGLLHAIGIDSVREAAGWDAVIGAGHGVAILAVMPMLLSTMHPLVRTGDMDAPGVAMVGFGPTTPVGSLRLTSLSGRSRARFTPPSSSERSGKDGAHLETELWAQRGAVAPQLRAALARRPRVSTKNWAAAWRTATDQVG